jgi:hypothetical protein
MKKHLHKGRCEVLKRLNGSLKDRKKSEKVKSNKLEKSKKFEKELKTKKMELQPKVIKQSNSSVYQQLTTINPNEISL